jgi:hypothetical protein
MLYSSEHTSVAPSLRRHLPPPRRARSQAGQQMSVSHTFNTLADGF